MKPSCSLPTVRSTLFAERHGTKASALAQQIIFNNIQQYTRLIPPLFVGQTSEAFKYPGGFWQDHLVVDPCSPKLTSLNDLTKDEWWTLHVACHLHWIQEWNGCNGETALRKATSHQPSNLAMSLWVNSVPLDGDLWLTLSHLATVR